MMGLVWEDMGRDGDQLAARARTEALAASRRLLLTCGGRLGRRALRTERLALELHEHVTVGLLDRTHGHADARSDVTDVRAHMRNVGVRFVLTSEHNLGGATVLPRLLQSGGEIRVFYESG